MKLIVNIIAILLLFLVNANLYAQRCKVGTIPATTPTSHFTSSIQGTIVDSATGLMWKVCPEGQTYEENTCQGQPLAVIWPEAIEQGTSSTFAGFTDWRVPNMKELASIVERQCYNPALNLTVFPEFSNETSLFSASFWSSTPSIFDIADRATGLSGYAYKINFRDGESALSRTGDKLQIRLVRDAIN